jgi:hypothetical protein
MVEPLNEAGNRLLLQVIEGAEVPEDRGRRHPGSTSDLVDRRREVTLHDEVEHRIDHGGPTALGPLPSAVNRSFR